MATAHGRAAGARRTFRVATFNVALAGRAFGEIAARMAGTDPRATAVAAIIRHVRPDILLLNEIDHDPGRRALDRFLHRYLGGGAGPRPPLRFPHTFTAPVNTGVASGFDLDRDGRRDGPGDALGFGRYPGQYGMAVLSRFPIDRDGVRTFRTFPWRCLPGAGMPVVPGTGMPWYEPRAAATLPLSSKSHWDVPVLVAGRRVHLLASHPTPPAFDGAERRNRLRNAAEVEFWRHYLDGERRLADDRGRAGGLAPAELAIVLGDLNSDPDDGDGDAGAIRALLGHRRLQDPRPGSAGAVEWARRARPAPAGDPWLKTAWFGCFALRVDFVLPDRRLRVRDAGVFWPRRADALASLVGVDGMSASSDHRLVWVDLEYPGPVVGGPGRPR